MKFLRLLILSSCIIISGCSDDNADDENVEDRLIQTGLLGNWEIADETVNGITDLLPRCCNFIELRTDDETEDLMGLFNFTDDLGGVYNGTFTVNEENQTILVQRENRAETVFDYTLNPPGDYLILNFSENDVLIEQGWIKRD